MKRVLTILGCKQFQYVLKEILTLDVVHLETKKNVLLKVDARLKWMFTMYLSSNVLLELL